MNLIDIRLKKNQGITLISLVITIIVMIIIAGIAVYLVVGNNGILTQSQNASKTIQKEQVIEDIELAYSSIISNYHNDLSKDSTLDKWNYVTHEKLIDELKRKR